MIKGVLFDYDDTLVTSKQSRLKALQYAAKKFYDLQLSDEDVLQYWGQSFDQFLENVFQHVDTPDHIEKNYLQIIHQFPLSAYEGAVEIVTNLMKDHLVGIVTSCGREVAMFDLERLGFPVNKLFAIQTSEDTQVHKPDPQVFAPILDKLAQQGVTKDEVIYVGDGINDYKAAVGAGLQFIGVVHNGDQNVFKDTQSPIVTSLKEIPSQIS